MIATNAMNGIVHSGHAYAMGSSGADLLPGAKQKEQFSGLNHVRFLNSIAKETNVDKVRKKSG